MFDCYIRRALSCAVFDVSVGARCLQLCLIGNGIIIRSGVQFVINLHEWVFQKAENARAALASAISAFCKTHE